MWLEALQKTLDSEVLEPQSCSLRPFLDRELTGNKDVAGSPTEKQPEALPWPEALRKSLDSEVSEPQFCSLRPFLDRELTGNEDMAGSPAEKLRFPGFRPPGLQLEGFLGQKANR